MPFAWNSDPRKGWSVLVLLIGLAAVGQAEVTAVVQASGLAPIAAGDLGLAFEQAKRAALREAVEEAVGTLITAQTRVQNFAVIEEDILSRTEGYVRRFSVVDQRRLDADTYQVTLEAVVGLGSLHRSLEALDLLIDAAGNPQILCLGQERRGEGEEQVTGSAVVVALERALQQASPRFNLLGPVAAGEQEQAFADPGAAAALGLSRGADIVVKGEARVQAAPGIKVPFSGGITLAGIGIHASVAQVRVEALWTDTGEIFAALSGVERAAATSREAAAEKAVRLGIERLAAQLVERLADDWREKVYSGRLLRLEVQADPKELQRFEAEFPARVSGIEKLYPRSLSAGLGVYDARSHYSGFQVARELAAKGLGEIEVQLVQVTANRIELRIEP